MRRALRTDSNEREITAALRKLGASVVHINAMTAGVPDLLVGLYGRNWLIEVKMPKTGRLSDSQNKWRDEWRGSRPFVIHDAADVVAFVGLVRLLPQEKKHHEIHK